MRHSVLLCLLWSLVVVEVHSQANVATDKPSSDGEQQSMRDTSHSEITDSM